MFLLCIHLHNCFPVVNSKVLTRVCCHSSDYLAPCREAREQRIGLDSAMAPNSQRD